MFTEFGFFENTFTAIEQYSPHFVKVGIISGPAQNLQANVNLDLITASKQYFGCKDDQASSILISKYPNIINH